MPTPVLAADLLLNAHMPGLEEMIANATESGFETGLTGAMGAEQKAITTAMFRARQNAIKLGRKDEADALKADFKQRVITIAALAKKKEATEKKLKEIEQKGASAAVKKYHQEKLASQMKLIATEQAALKKANKDRADADRRRLEIMEEGLKRSARSFGQKVEDGLEGAADNFDGMIQQALSAENLDLGGLIRGGGQRLKGAAPDLMAGGKKLAAFGAKTGGVMGKAAAMLGSSAAALGAAAGVIAGAAAVVAAFVAVIMAAYGQTKEFNKAILEGSSAVDMLSTDILNSEGSSRALTQELGSLRQSAMGVALMMRTSTEEVLALSSAMNQAGFTFKEQRRTFGKYSQAMMQGVITMQAFGIGAGEYAEAINTMTRDFAYGQQNIADGFGDIFGAAQMSGMGVKNFFTAISEATSGMALYNFRLEDTLELMLGLEKLLGEDLAKEIMGQLKGKYKGMGTTERMKAVMTSGEAGRGVLATSATAQIAAFQELLDDAPEGMAKALADAGMKTAEDIRDMSPQQVAQLANIMDDFGEQGEAMGRKVMGLGRAARGAREGAGLGARAEALGELDQLGTMAMNMSQAYAVLGDKALTDLSGVTKAAFEEVTGLSGEALTAYQDIYARQEAAMGPDATFEEVIAAIQRGEAGISNEDLEEAMKNAEDPMRKLAEAQLTETQSILQTLKTGVVIALEGIYEGLFNWTGESIQGARKAMEEAQQAAADDPTNVALAEEAKMREKAYKAVLEGGTTAKVYEDALAGVSPEVAQAAGLAHAAGSDAGSAEASGYRAYLERAYHSAQTGAKYGALGGPTGMLVGGMGAASYSMGSDLLSLFSGEDVDLTFEQMTDEQRAMVAELAAGEAQRSKDAKSQEKATDKVTKAVKDAADKEAKEREDILLKEMGYEGDVTDKAALDTFIKGLTGDDKILAQGARGRLTQRNLLNDFIYRGDGTRGDIFPINGRDVIGTLSDGSGPLAGMGKGVSINKIIVYESGDPQKTLAMVKQGVDAAMRKA